jgi:hypothetical protein
VGVVVAQTIVDNASKLLHDTSHAHWTEAELLEYLNEGQRRICLKVPTAYTKNSTVALGAGSRQTIPAEAQLLLDVCLDTSGNYVRRVSFKEVRAYSSTPGTQSANTEEWAYEPEKTPKTWWCWPPNNGAGSVNIDYAAVPTDIALVDVILINDTWESTLLDWILFRALSKEKQTKDTVRANLYLESFTAAVGG